MNTLYLINLRSKHLEIKEVQPVKETEKQFKFDKWNSDVGCQTLSKSYIETVKDNCIISYSKEGAKTILLDYKEMLMNSAYNIYLDRQRKHKEAQDFVIRCMDE